MANLTDLPPELLDHITAYLPTASSVSNLSRSNRSLKQAVEKDGWVTFNRSRFPYTSLPHHTHDTVAASYHKDVARTLCTLSKNWDRRAFAARYVEPNGNIRAFPGGNKIKRWKRPRGQTIGFTPQLDSYETVGGRWSHRDEVLALSAGAEICVRVRRSSRNDGHGIGRRQTDTRWTTYRPSAALEGRDDVTSLHLLQPSGGEGSDVLQVIRGTANGDLDIQRLPLDPEQTTTTVETTDQASYSTDGLPVRSTSLLQRSSQPALLAAALGETRISLWSLSESPDVNEAPATRIEITRPQNGSRSYRTWSTNFLSSSKLAVGVGPSEDPIHVYSLTSSGIDKDHVRRFSLQNDLDRLAGEITLSGFAKKSTSSVYPIVPLDRTGNNGGSLFLSGAYDGMVRLHDLRSDQHVAGAYIDPTDDSAIYSLLPRGREKLVVGTSRHSLLKVFDLRMGAKCYSYLDAASQDDARRKNEWRSNDWNLFLKPHSATYPGRGGGNNWARRSAESSIYSLTSPSDASPYFYAGVESAVLELAFTDLLDRSPDPAFFDPNPVVTGTKMQDDKADSEILSLAMYEQNAEKMELLHQRSIVEMRSLRRDIKNHHQVDDYSNRGLDERWRVNT